MARNISAFLFFLLLAIFLRWQAVPYLSTHFIGGSERDAGLYIWLLQSAGQALSLNHWFDTKAFYPYEKSLAFSDNFLFPSMVGQLLLRIGFSLPLSYNLLLLSALTLNGYCTYRLAYLASKDPWASLAGGSLFASYSFLQSHSGHPQLQFACFIPLAAELLHLFLATAKPFFAFLFGLTFLLSFLTTVYYSVFIEGMALVLTLGHLFRNDRESVGLLVKKSAPAVFVTACLILPFAVPYTSVKSAFGSRFLHEAHAFSANAWSYFSTGPFNLLYGETSSWTHPESWLFPGFLAFTLSAAAVSYLVRQPRDFGSSIAIIFFTALTLLSSALGARYGTVVSLWGLAGSAVWLLWQGRLLSGSLSFTATYLALAALAFVISFGPQGLPERGESALAPFIVPFSTMPGFDAVRAIGRVGVLLALSLAVLLSIAIEKFSKARVALVSVACSAFITFENYNRIFPIELLPEKPAVLNLLPQCSKVIALPFTARLPKGQVESWSDYAKVNITFMNWLVESSATSVNGYSGMRPELLLTLARWTRNFPDKASIRGLKRIAGLEYILFSGSFRQNFQKEEFERAAAELAPELELVGKDEKNNYLFRLSKDVVVQEAEDFYLPPSAQEVRLDITSSSPSVEIEDLDWEKKKVLRSQVFPLNRDPIILFPLSGKVLPNVLRLKLSEPGNVVLTYR